MVGRPNNERALYVAVIASIALAVGIVILVRRPENTVTNTITNNPARATYAALSDALWRQDEGRGSVLMTATLVVPAMVDALGQDTQRSELETQILAQAKKLSTRQIGIYVTIDSIDGYLADDVLEAAFSASIDPDSVVETITWEPMIGTAAPVVANVPTTSQRGLAIITVTEKVDWENITTLTMRASGLGGLPTRQFVWQQVSELVSAAQE